MKKIIVVALSVLFCIAMSGCSLFARTIPEGFSVFGINLGGMTEEEAIDTLKTAIDGYTINATIGADTFVISAEQIGVKFNESYNLDDMVKRTNDGSLTSSMIESEIISISDDYTVEEGLREAYYSGLVLKQTDLAAQKEENAELVKTLEEASKADAETAESVETTSAEKATSSTSTTPQVKLTDAEIDAKIDEYQAKLDKVYDNTRAHIEFDEKVLAYIAVDGVAGDTNDCSGAVKTLKDAAKKFSSNVTLVIGTKYSNGELASTIPAISAGIADGNKYLTIKIDYNFDVPEGERVTETLDKTNIYKYLYVAPNGRAVLIDETSLAMYSSDITTKNAKITSKDTLNEDKTFTTTRTGKSADPMVVYDNIYEAMKDQRSATFEAKYEEINETITSENGSTYVYVDLDAQKVYLYENGKVTVTADCVSGSVAGGHSTPTGVFSIYYKQRNTTLRGPGYASFVNYWMPFNGGIGLHDADGWRSTYGGNIYQYSGSHGCINLPKWAAAAIFEKVDAGTRVIVTGGVQSSYRAVDKVVETTTTAAPTTQAVVNQNNNQNNQNNNQNNNQANNNATGSNETSAAPSTEAETTTSAEESGVSPD